jgi:hypothetical protein
MLADLTMIATLPVDQAALQKATAEDEEVRAQQPETPHPDPWNAQVARAASGSARRSASQGRRPRAEHRSAADRTPVQAPSEKPGITEPPSPRA